MLFQYNEPYYKPERSYMSKTICKYLESCEKDNKRGRSYNVSRSMGALDGNERNEKGVNTKKKMFYSSIKFQNCDKEVWFYKKDNEKLQKEIAEYQMKMKYLEKQIRMLEEYKRNLTKQRKYEYEWEDEQCERMGRKGNQNVKKEENGNWGCNNEKVNTINSLSITVTEDNENNHQHNNNYNMKIYSFNNNNFIK